MNLSISVLAIVRILEEDPILINKWVKFADSLGIKVATLESLKRQYTNGNLTVYELLKEILNNWVAVNGNRATVDSLITVLQGIGEINCADKLAGCKTRHLSTTIRFGVGRMLRNFEGRQNELTLLKAALNSDRNQIIVISGLGGMGKTELAKKFISLLPPDHVVSWLSGETEDTFRSSLTQFCDYLGIPTSEDNEPIESTQLIQTIVHQLKEDRADPIWTVVVDNVDIVHEGFTQGTQTLLTFPNTFVVVTSRTKDIFLGEAETLELMELRDEEAVQFIQSALGPGTVTSDALALCQTLQNYPLALQQAVAYIKQRRSRSPLGPKYGIPEYLADFDLKFKEVVGKPMQLMGYNKTTLTVWELTIGKIRLEMGPVGQLAYNVLEVLAFVNLDGIHVNFLQHLVSHLTRIGSIEEEWESAVETLNVFSLVRCDDSVLTLHRLVQKVTQARMQETPTSANKQFPGCRAAAGPATGKPLC